MTVYKSKIGPELAIPLSIVLGGALLLMAFGKHWSGLLLMVVLIAFVAHLFLTTKYTVEGNTLVIQAGFIVKKTIDIRSIRKLAETRNPLSSPAASLDRIKITYNRYDYLMISPEDKMAFIRHLTSINPAIEVKLKTA